jgi:sugar phosphate isomerase/epimerase
MNLDSINRRQAIAATATLAYGTLATAATAKPADTCTLGFGVYGLPELSTEAAIDAVAAAGYDSIELYLLADRDLDAANVGSKRRRELRGRLADKGLKLASLMENLRPIDSLARHQADLKRLDAACRLARELNPDDPPAVQTVLGGKQWQDVRELCAKRLPDWARIAAEHGVVVAVKPHRGHAMNQPSHAAWLLKELGNPAFLRMWFDYSHFAFRDLPMEQMISQALPITAGVAVKDAVQIDGRVTFALPGQGGTIDYVKLLKLLYAGGYRGDIAVEVSSAVWKQPDYDAQSALKDCYDHLSSAFRAAGVPRRSP